jgi:hypothetical protein
MIAKICYNLLVSEAYPSIRTYQIMLEHFTRLQHHNLAQAVIDSFFDDSRLSPTAGFVAAMLDHYAAIKDSIGFYSVVQRMRGKDGGIRISRRMLSRHSEDWLLSWVKDKRVLHNDGFLFTKMPRDPRVFNSLIQGCLRFSGKRRAMRYFRAAIREGQIISADTFQRLAEYFKDKVNLKYAIALLSTMASQWHQRKGFAELARHEVVRSNIFHLMKIYGIRPSMSAFDVERLGFGWGFNLDAFKLWLEDLYVEDIKGKRRDLDFQVITLKVRHLRRLL